jgi:hypothetical protein
VVINEWMADNAGPGASRSGRWIVPGLVRAHQSEHEPNQPFRYYLTDTLVQPAKWRIPTNTVISARGFWCGLGRQSNQSKQRPARQRPPRSLCLDAERRSDRPFRSGWAYPAIYRLVPLAKPERQSGWFPDGDTNVGFIR